MAIEIEWEKLGHNATNELGYVWRCRAPGGWLVAVGPAPQSMVVTYVPDAGHRWLNNVNRSSKDQDDSSSSEPDNTRAQMTPYAPSISAFGNKPDE